MESPIPPREPSRTCRAHLAPLRVHRAASSHPCLFGSLARNACLKVAQPGPLGSLVQVDFGDQHAAPFRTVADAEFTSMIPDAGDHGILARCRCRCWRPSRSGSRWREPVPARDYRPKWAWRSLRPPRCSAAVRLRENARPSRSSADLAETRVKHRVVAARASGRLRFLRAADRPCGICPPTDPRVRAARPCCRGPILRAPSIPPQCTADVAWPVRRSIRVDGPGMGSAQSAIVLPVPQ